jgi:aryl-alcohol dehydrogenase-like predicted oxidoreductase
VISFEQAGGLGMGCWQLAGDASFGGKVNGYGVLSESQGIATVQFALDQGIHFFDTADGYGHGRSEEVLGKALKGRREEALICTKFGPRENEQGEGYLDFSADYTREAVEASLERLQTNYLDILLLHNPPDDFDWANYDKSSLEELKAEGKIRAYGVSCRSVYGAVRVVEAGFGDFVELIFNLLDRRAEELLFEKAKAAGIKIIARVPLASGFLTDRMLQQDPNFPLNDIRHYFPQDQVKWTLESVRKLAFLAEEPGGLSRSALRFAIHHPNVYVVIPGMKNETQVSSNRKALDAGPLSKDQIERVKEAVPQVFHKWLPRS